VFAYFLKLARAVTFLFIFAGCSGEGSSSGAPETVQTAVTASCSESNVYRIDLPQYPDRQDTTSFKYAFQILWSPYGILAPTIINLPGGPGYTSIGIGRAGAGSIPAHYNVILTDQRGTGCNASSLGPDGYSLDFYSTEYMARDVIGLIKHLKLTNYYIFGTSYGTVHGTAIANLLAKEGLPQPKGLILQATLGRAYETMSEVNQYYVRQWNRVKPMLNPDILNKLSTETEPYGYSLTQWRSLLDELVFYGDIPGIGAPVPYTLNPLASSDPVIAERARLNLQTQMSRLQSSKRKNYKIVMKVYCEELFGTMETAGLENGEFTMGGEDFCAQFGIPSLTRRYDSANQQVQVPIYYFVGPNDTSTPIEQGRYHFNGQIQSKRYFTVVSGAGHYSLALHLAAQGCAGAVWDAIVLNPSSLGQALDRCQWPYTLEVKNPGE
jgi:pimeloyl-ACP methyl ester carboxylesterase